ncbi:MAG TPA: polyphosphate:AMP phosphotransferase [Burkholderiaceae bacterium]|jgi:polyphosphate:AMP phosphotransferase|nr:polyphosphate:AMP phosphotransferase [Burkholderiaceae bacterium]
MATPSDTARFDAAEADPSLSREDAKPLIAELRSALLKAQYARLSKADRSLLVVIAGIDGAGKGATINLINEWMDPRHIRTLAFGPPSAEEREYPFLWRYWRHLPAKGSTGIVFGSWYAPLFEVLAGKNPKRGEVERLAASIRDFEALLARDGVQVIKLWYHLSRDAQKKRCTKLAKNPETAWMVRPEDLRVAREYKRLRKAGATMLALTDTPLAPWQVIPSADEDMRAVSTGTAILEALRAAPYRPSADPHPPAVPAPASYRYARRPRPLSLVDHSLRLSENEYDDQLAHWRGRLARQVRSKAFDRLPVVLVFEGRDAAGKGSTIRRITHVLDARQFRAVPISAPTSDELARPYLWRFWRELPRPGNITIFDRSWYGRVLVERVEKFAKPHEWRRAYEEINQFERQLGESGILVMKFWLDITKEIQLERFHDRERSPFKSFKITPEDWRNREQWPAYTSAVNEMLDLTNTTCAPWHVIPSDDKRYARVTVLEKLVTAIDGRLS